MKDLLNLLKLHLVIDEPSQDVLLEHYLKTAMSAIEKYSGIDISPRDIEEHIFATRKEGRAYLCLSHKPSSKPAVIFNGSAVQKINYYGSDIFLPCSYIGKPVVVRYKVGVSCLSNLNSDLVHAIIIMAAFSYSHRGDQSSQSYGVNTNSWIDQSGAADYLSGYRRVAY